MLPLLHLHFNILSNLPQRNSDTAIVYIELNVKIMQNWFLIELKVKLIVFTCNQNWKKSAHIKEVFGEFLAFFFKWVLK